MISDAVTIRTTRTASRPNLNGHPGLSDETGEDSQASITSASLAITAVGSSALNGSAWEDIYAASPWGPSIQARTPTQLTFIIRVPLIKKAGASGPGFRVTFAPTVSPTTLPVPRSTSPMGA